MSSPNNFPTAYDESLPNPHTPLAFLAPTLANQLEVARYLMVATCGMFSWDILMNIRNDYRMLTKSKITVPLITYFISRHISLVYIITATTFQIGTAQDCQALQIAQAICFAVAIAATSLLFYFRVCAVFNQSVFIRILFGILWLTALAGCIIIPFSITGGHIGTTNYCINFTVLPRSSMAIVASTINDTLICLFITWRLAQSTLIDSPRDRLRALFGGKGLPGFTKSLLQNGQEYYLITVCGNILTMALILAPSSLPPVYHAMAAVPNMAVTNAMACRVFRDIKLGKISEDGTSATRLTGILPTFAHTRGPREETSTMFSTNGVSHSESLGAASSKPASLTPPSIITSYHDTKSDSTSS